jgi:hypothetical protein
VPVLPEFKERITVRTRQLTIYPTPTYTMTRQLRYKAGWVSTPDDYGEVYEEMGEEEASIILLKAKSLAQKKKEDAAGGKGYRYQVGGVSVDTTSQAGVSVKSAESWQSEYESRVEKYNGTAFIFE